MHERTFLGCNVANTLPHSHTYVYYDSLTVLPHEFGLIWYGDDALFIAFAQRYRGLYVRYLLRFSKLFLIKCNLCFVMLQCGCVECASPIRFLYAI